MSAAFPLDRRTELQIGGVWTDVTGDVREKAPIRIERGAKSESAKSAPSKLSLTLNNRHGRYSPRNPLSPYYGLIGRNTPIRVSVKGPESYLALDGTEGSHATTPDAAALDITGDLDLRVEATADWTATRVQTLLGKWDSSASQRSYLLFLQAGTLHVWFSTTGADAYFAQRPLPALPRRAALRATLDANNGAGGWTVRMYWAPAIDDTWTEFAVFTDTSIGPITLHSGTAPLRVAPTSVTISPSWRPLNGRVHCAQVRSGINGVLAAELDVRALPEGTTGWTDPVGRVWSLVGSAQISDRQYRFTGEVSTWPTRWDLSGSDVWVTIEGNGVTRRLSQGKKALDSTLRRRIPTDPDLIAYWPMEDGNDATAAYSPLPGVQPLTVAGLDFAADDTLGGSAALPKLKNPSSLRGTVPRSTRTGWQIEFVYYLPAMPAVQTEILRVSVAGSVMRTAVVYASTAGVRVEALDGEGSVLAFILFSNASAIADFWGKWNRLAIYPSDAGGGSTRLFASWRDIAADSRWYASTLFTGTQGSVYRIDGSWGAGTADMVIGHIACFDAAAEAGSSSARPGSAIFSGADDGFAGETVINRMARLANEESAQVELTWIDGDLTAPSEAMGPQRPGTLLGLLEQAGDTDGGILYEHRERTALVYRDRASLYNQPVRLALDYTANGEVPPGLEPVEDDQLLRNDVTVTRSGGGSGRAVLETGALSVLPPPDGVGPYDEALTLSLHEDAQAERIAQWRVHLGTWDEARYPTITVWLHAAPHLVESVLDLDIGDRVTISSPPPWLPPGLIDQHMRGYTETLGLTTWALAMNCAPAGPWTVGVLEDPVLGRADTDGSELAAGVTASATSWSVAVTDGPLWITTATRPLEFPFSVTCGGEEVTVTAISGVSSPQTFTVTRSVNGIAKAQSAGTSLSLTHPMRLAL